MWDLVNIVGRPYQINPWYVPTILEFMEVLHEQCITLGFNVQDPEASTIFRAANHLPGGQRVALVSVIRFLCPKGFPSDSVKKVNDLWR